MVDDANSADDATNHLSLVEALHIRGIANDKGRRRLLSVADDAGNLAVLEANLLNWRVQHVSSTVDGAKTRERLRQATNTVHGVQEGRVTIFAQRGSVKLHALDRVHRRLLAVAVVGVERNSVAEEINCVLLERVLLEDVVHAHLAQILITEGHGVFLVDLIDVKIEVAQALLLEQAHKGRLECLLVGGGHLADNILGVAKHAALLMLQHVGGIGALPFQVASHLGVQEHLHELAVGHHELGDQIHVPLAVVPVLLGRLHAGAEHRPQVGQVERRSVRTVVTVAVQVEHALALLGEQTGQDALLEARAHDNNIVAFVHSFS